MEKYKEVKKKYNSDKTFVQISKTLHESLKLYCQKNNLSIKDFLESLIIKNI